MDRLLYTSMKGAINNTKAQTVHSNNLANARTTGFRGDLAQARSMQLFGEHFPSRVYSLTENLGTDFLPGSLLETGRELDVAVEGDRFIPVQGPNLEEAFTRAGDFYVDDLGNLRTGTGIPVMGDGGPIVVPPFEKMEIGRDGTVSIRGQGQTPEALTQVNRIKLANPDLAGISKGADGLFRRNDGLIEPEAADVQITSGFLETSNVNAVSEMTAILELSRQFELQVKMMRMAEEMDESASRLLQVN